MRPTRPAHFEEVGQIHGCYGAEWFIMQQRSQKRTPKWVICTLKDVVYISTFQT